jgi:N-acyl-D-aspartate/D-glutamate deacylase
MRGLTKEAIIAGALGFSSTRTIAHRTKDNDLTPSYGAARQELSAIAQGLADAAAGVMQYTTENADEEAEWDLLCAVTKISQRPMSVSVGQAITGPEKWRKVLQRIEKARGEGLQIMGQVPVRAIGLMLGLQGTVHPFVTRPSYREIAHLSPAERARAMRDPARRARILSEKATGGTNFLDAIVGGYDRMFHLGDPPNYEPHPDDSIGAEARGKGISPQELAYEILTADDGKGFLYCPRTNYVEGDLEVVRAMLASPVTVNGLSDGGAHVGVICDASMPTFLLTHWARDRVRGEKFDIEYLVRRQTHETAKVLGLLDRGVLRPGYRADINVIDFDKLQLKVPEMRYDLPTGAKRLYQETDGYVATIVAGQATYRDGQPTGRFPGRLIRGGRGVPN